MINGLLARHPSSRRIVRPKVHRKLAFEALEERCLLAGEILTLTSASSAAGSTTIRGTLSGDSNRDYVLEFLSRTACSAADPNSNAEFTFIGITSFTTDNRGDVRDPGPNIGFVATFNTVPGAGQGVITANDVSGSNASGCTPIGVGPAVGLIPNSGAEWLTTPDAMGNMLPTQYNVTARVETAGANVQFRVTRGGTVVTTGQIRANADRLAFFSYTESTTGIDTIEASVNGTAVGSPATVEWINRPASSDVQCSLDPQDALFPVERFLLFGGGRTITVTVGSNPDSQGTPTTPQSGATVSFRANLIEITGSSSQPVTHILDSNIASSDGGGATNSNGQDSLTYARSIPTVHEIRVVGQYQDQTFLCKTNVTWVIASPRLTLSQPTLDVGTRIVTVTAQVAASVTAANGTDTTLYPIEGVTLDLEVKRFLNGTQQVAATGSGVTDRNGAARLTYVLPLLGSQIPQNTTDTITVTGVTSGTNLRKEITQTWIADCVLVPELVDISLGRQVSVFAAAGYAGFAPNAPDARINQPVSYRVIDGPNAGRGSLDSTQGFTYTGRTIGVDRIEASVQVGATLFPCRATTIDWREMDTPVGTNVIVRPFDPMTGAAPITLRFANVTAPGSTSFVIREPTGQQPPPTGYRLANGPGNVYLYFEISTTATFSTLVGALGAIEICFDLRVNFDNNMFLQHFVNGEWQAIGGSQNQNPADPICGNVNSLSPFAIFEPVPGGNVTVQVRKGRLTVLGDADNNSIRIEPGAAANSLRITGEETLINGDTPTVEVSGVTRGIQVTMGDGHDSVVWLGNAALLRVRQVQINAGAGNDYVALNGLSLQGSLQVDAGSGTDRIDLIDTVLSGKVSLLLGDDADTAIVQNSNLPGKLLLDTGTGDDVVRFADSTVARGSKARIAGGDGLGDRLDAGRLTDTNSRGNVFDSRLRFEDFETAVS